MKQSPPYMIRPCKTADFNRPQYRPIQQKSEKIIENKQVEKYKCVFPDFHYNNKAKNIKACARKIVDEFNSVVPEQIELLTTLPGVGRKTANVVRSVCFGIQTIVVDTHVHRISRRLGLSDKKDPVKVEFELMEILPKPVWNDISLQFIYFGREICDAKKPLCDQCFLYDICPTRGK